MEPEHSALYRNLISILDIDRNINAVAIVSFNAIEKSPFYSEFSKDIFSSNDQIELNLVKHNAYSEGILLTLHTKLREDPLLMGLVLEHQRTFGGSKLFYLNESKDKILVLALPGSMEGKLQMVVNRINKVNEKVHRLNQKIKKDNIDNFTRRQGSTDKKDLILNVVNKNLKV